MKKVLLTFLLISLFGFGIYGQSTKLEVFIQVTDTLFDEGPGGITVEVLLSTDDVEEENGKMAKLHDDDLDVGWEGGVGDQNLLTIGFRFRDIIIPQGATIDSAFITVHAHEGKGKGHVCLLNIHGEATDNTMTFDLINPVSARPMTSDSVMWIIEEAWIIWKPYKSIDMSALIQEIVNRPGWKLGNSLALIIEGQDQGVTDTMENAREFMSFENIQDPGDVDPFGVSGDGKNHPDKVPKLTIYYSAEVSVPGVYDPQSVFDVYPNPAKGMVNVSLKSSGTARIQIFNVTGQMVRSAEITSQKGTLDVRELKSGIYLFRAIQGNTIHTQKVILK